MRKATSLTGAILFRLIVSIGAGVVTGTVSGLVAAAAGGEDPNRSFLVGFWVMTGLMFLVKTIELFTGASEKAKR